MKNYPIKAFVKKGKKAIPKFKVKFLFPERENNFRISEISGTIEIFNLKFGLEFNIGLGEKLIKSLQPIIG